MNVTLFDWCLHIGKKRSFILALLVVVMLTCLALLPTSYFDIQDVNKELELIKFFKTEIYKTHYSTPTKIDRMKKQPEDGASETAADCNTSSCWDSVLDSDTVTGAQILQYFLWTNRSSCQLAHDFGGKMMKKPSGLDGQKTICIDPRIAPKSGDCLVYSFGIDNEWSFDEQMERYGCQVFAFDPSINREPHDHSPSIHFYDWGLSYQNENRSAEKGGWKVRTLATIFDILSDRHGKNKPIDFLKIDIESAEWQVLPEIIHSGMLSKIRQLGVEFHLEDFETIDKYLTKAKVIRNLEKNGMVRFDSKFNPWLVGEFTELKLWASQGYEIAWYNSKLEHSLEAVRPQYIDFLNSFKRKLS